MGNLRTDVSLGHETFLLLALPVPAGPPLSDSTSSAPCGLGCNTRWSHWLLFHVKQRL
ncbi:hypothetical protein SAMN04487912_106168 [Arthrobacter sp. cf158]|nr:hypothetical protein SAMN04487912_106168 [Arthrobacter sp. cf158]